MSKAKKLFAETNANQNDLYKGRVGLVYARVSSKKQETEGHGRKSQEDRCKNDLASINVPHQKSFIDTYTGGGDFMSRPAMRELLKYIDANPKQKYVVVFDDLKRFARDTIFHLKLRTTLKILDVLPRCLNYRFDDSPEGMFVETVLAAGNELERLQNARQVGQKMRSRLEDGYWPFASKKGYDMIDDPLHGKLCVPNNEGAVLAEALEGFADRTFPRKIDACRFLVEKGIWKKEYIDKFTEILKDSFYAGYIEYPAWDVTKRDGHHKAIISLETFEKNQKILKKEPLMVKVRKDMSEDFPIRGLVYCDHCNGHLTAAFSKKIFPYYICHNKACEFYGKSIPKNIIEAGFLAVLQKNTLKTEIDALVGVVFDRVWDQEIRSVEALKANKTKERQELDKMAIELTKAMFDAKTTQTKNLFERQLDDVAKRIEELDAELENKIDLSIPYRTALNKATELLKYPYNIWQTMNVTEQHRLFFFIFEEKLPYNQITGYRTDKISSISALFEEFSNENSSYVDLGGIEPPLRQCE